MHHWIQRIFLHILAPVIFLDIFSKLWFFDIRIIKNCIIWMFWRLGTMPKRFFIAKSFRLHISKPKKIPGNIFFDISKMIVWLCTLYLCCLCIMAMYHGYVSWLCIMAIDHVYFLIFYKRVPLICPQGPKFWNIL